MKAAVFRIRKRYYDAIVDGRKTIEYRKGSMYWTRRLLGKNPPTVAVFICGKRVHRREITKIEYGVPTLGLGFSEQGKKDVNTKLCFAIHLGKEI